MVGANEAFVVRIPVAMYEEMVAHVVAGYPNETCGMLASKDGQVVKNYPATNAAEHPDDFSEISPEDLLHIAYDIDEYDGEMYAYYHSHPKTEAYPSRRDIEWARHNKLIYIIFSHRFYPERPYARAFLIADDGTVSEGKVEEV
ncbi:MAG: Mov34/MPN/PAD-1 family protein [Ktedonobacteraceae bacterium]